MVLTLLLPPRAIYGLHDLLTQRHIDNIPKLLATGYGWLRLCDGIFITGTVRTPMKDLHLSTEHSQLLVVLLDHGFVQCYQPTALLVQRLEKYSPCLDVQFCEYWYVV